MTTIAPSADIATALRQVFPGPVWHGPSLSDLLGGVSAQQAAAHPIRGAHSIWELVLHVASWAQIARERLAGDAEPPSPERDFPAVGDATPPRWAEAVARLERVYEHLADEAAALDASALAAVLPGRAYTARALLDGVIAHAAYHGGQIAILRRALGVAAS